MNPASSAHASALKSLATPEIQKAESRRQIVRESEGGPHCDPSFFQVRNHSERLLRGSCYSQTNLLLIFVNGWAPAKWLGHSLSMAQGNTLELGHCSCCPGTLRCICLTCKAKLHRQQHNLQVAAARARSSTIFYPTKTGISTVRDPHWRSQR